MEYLGNKSLLDLSKHGFLCSRCTRSSVILPCLDWAVEQSRGTVPIMSTFHSKMEEAVFDILMKGSCPLILVLGRSLYKELPQRLRTLLDSNRLLVISIVEQKRISKKSAFECNKYICEHSEYLTFGYLSENSSLNMLYEQTNAMNKKIKIISQN